MLLQLNFSFSLLFTNDSKLDPPLFVCFDCGLDSHDMNVSQLVKKKFTELTDDSLAGLIKLW